MHALKIEDLSKMEELDCEAMAALRGGTIGTAVWRGVGKFFYGDVVGDSLPIVEIKRGL